MPKFVQTLVVSPVGTSLLTNKAEPEVVKILRDTANLLEGDLSREDCDVLEARIASVTERVRSASEADLKRMSAELNGVLSGGMVGKEFTHYLICTDTFQGRATGAIVKECLEALGVHVSIFVARGLSTARQDRFAQGIDEILRWMETTVKPFRESGYRVVFNLVGGFKSILAYLQMLGMVYADEMVYIFEDQASLLRIPRLPLSFEHSSLERHKGVFVRLATGREGVSAPEVEGAPEVYVEMADGVVCLTHWGQLAWNAEKRTILSGELIEQEGLLFEPSFRRDYKDCKEPSKREKLQEVLAEVALLWKAGGLRKLRADTGILYETYQNKGGIGHFRINSGDRVSCLPDGNVLRLRRFGSHDINDTP